MLSGVIMLRVMGFGSSWVRKLWVMKLGRVFGVRWWEKIVSVCLSE